MMQAKRSRGTRTPCLLDGFVRLDWPGLGNGQLKVDLCPGLPRIWGTGQSGVSCDDLIVKRTVGCCESTGVALVVPSTSACRSGYVVHRGCGLVLESAEIGSSLDTGCVRRLGEMLSLCAICSPHFTDSGPL